MGVIAVVPSEDESSSERIVHLGKERERRVVRVHADNKAHLAVDMAREEKTNYVHLISGVPATRTTTTRSSHWADEMSYPEHIDK